MFPVTQLGPDDYIMEESVVRQSRDGFYYVSPIVPPGQIAVYDSTGTFRWLIGGYGDGPGELREVSEVIPLRGDTVAAIAGLAMSVFLRDGTFIRRNVLNGYTTHASPAAAGTILMSHRPVFNSNRAQILYVDSYGNIERELQATGRDVSVVADYGDRVVLATRTDRSVLLSLTDGRKAVARANLAPWTGKMTPPSGVRQSGGSVIDVFLNGDTAWVLTNRKHFRVTPVPVSEGEAAARRLTLDERKANFEPFIEVVDLMSGRVILTVKWPGRVLRVTRGPRSLFYSYEESADGNPYILVWQPSIQRTQHRR